jgi:hypothetical protein
MPRTFSALAILIGLIGAPVFLAAQVPVPGSVASSRSATGRPSAPQGRAAGTDDSYMAADAGVLTGHPAILPAKAVAPPEIDGRLDDATWQAAARITTFIQQEPVEGAPASEATEVTLAYDRDNLYVGIYAHYADVNVIRANHVDRDQTGDDDTVSIYIDPFRDQQRAYVFSVNGYGVQSDAIAGSDGGRDSSWNQLYRSAGRLVRDGWTAELAIPFKSLRYPARSEGDTHRWGFQIRREIESRDEASVWAPISRDIPGFLKQMGLLEGLTGLSRSRNLEVQPTVTVIDGGTLDRGSGVFARETEPQAGANVKYGLTSNLTLDVTFNPEFSQIESDRPQIEVNQRFPLFFSELRPFFIEGQEIFQLPGPVTFVHTRTIVDPRYGAKLSGKVGRTTLGFVVANDEAPGKVDDRADPAFGRSATTVIGRARYDLYSESFVGVIATDREFLDRYSRLGGVDGNFRLGVNHRFGFRAIASDRRDERGTRNTGTLLDMAFRKEGRNLSYAVTHYEIEPGFGTDAGFVRRVDTKQTSLSVDYRWWPESWITDWGPSGDYSRNYDYAGVLQNEKYSASADIGFARNIGADIGVVREMERFGGVDFWKTRASFSGHIDTSRVVSLGGSYNAGDQIRFVDDPFLARGTEFSVDLTLRPFSRLQSRIDLDSSRLVDQRAGGGSGVEVFDVKTYRALTTYQFTNRLLVRNIAELNSFNKTLGLNLLLTYRVNAGTVFFAGYDDRYQQGGRIDATRFPVNAYQRTNRALFTKFQYLFRY